MSLEEEAGPGGTPMKAETIPEERKVDQDETILEGMREDQD